MDTYRDHQSCSRLLDKVSMYGLRPPELVGVFNQIKGYYRFCHTDDRVTSYEDMKSMMSHGLDMTLGDFYPWFDCLGRHVKIRSKAVSDVSKLAKQNLQDIATDPYWINNDASVIHQEANEAVLEMIEWYRMPEEECDLWQSEIKDYISKFFFEEDSHELLPIPVTSSVHPSNSQQFFVHVVLKFGRYVTEIDAFQSGSPRDVFRATRLIGEATDDQSLTEYSSKLLKRYVEEEACYLENSMRKTSVFIVAAERFFDDVILRDEFSSETDAFTMTGLHINEEKRSKTFWQERKQKVLASALFEVGNLTGIPSRLELENVGRDCPLRWDPWTSMTPSEDQSPESFEEQRFALKVAQQTIDKYRYSNSMTHTKACIVHGAPGTGKTFVGKVSILLAISRGLRIIPTSIVAHRATAMGGIHLHRLLHWTKGNSGCSPYRIAEIAMQKLMRDPLHKQILLTLDALYIDEIGTLSAELLTVVEIMFRRGRHSRDPFGGLCILGSLDNEQTGAIKAMPFLTSSLILTSFVMVELRHSVRAHRDSQFQLFQKIIRTNPYELRENAHLKSQFDALIDPTNGIFPFVDSFTSPAVKSNMTRIFSRKISVREANAMFTEQLQKNLRRERKPFRVRQSTDHQREINSNMGWSNARDSTVKALNKGLREPEVLVLHEMGVYEITVNDPTEQNRYQHSCLALLIDLPSREDVARFAPIKVWVAPVQVEDIEIIIEQGGALTKEVLKQRLREEGWTEVSIGVPSRENVQTVRGGYHAKRQQYPLNHLGAVTAHKAQGGTYGNGIAVEFTHRNHPWDKACIVVIFSRAKTASQTVIVHDGDTKFVTDLIWDLITKAHQWTKFESRVLDMVTLNRSQGTNADLESTVLDYHVHYPFNIQTAVVPSINTSVVYILISKPDQNFLYIGETDNMNRRFSQHNSGSGSEQTAPIRLRPFAIAALITGLPNNRSVRMSLERNWKEKRNQLRRDGAIDAWNIINLGRLVASDHNRSMAASGNCDKCLFSRFVTLKSRQQAMEMQRDGRAESDQ